MTADSWYSWNPRDPVLCGQAGLCESVLRFTNYTPCFNANLDRPDQPDQSTGSTGRGVISAWNLLKENWPHGEREREKERKGDEVWTEVPLLSRCCWCWRWWNSHKSFLIELRQEITSKLSRTHSHITPGRTWSSLTSELFAS